MKRYKKTKKNNFGFTLIEILIVISIVGILSSFVVTNTIDVQKKVRDQQRKVDIQKMRSALEDYYTVFNMYPISSSNNYQLNNTPCLQPFLSGDTTYLQQIPCDPLGVASNFNNGNYYYYSPDGHSYTVAGCLERKDDPDGQASIQ